MMPEGPEVRTLVDQLQPGVGLRLCDLQVSSISGVDNDNSNLQALNVSNFQSIRKVRIWEIYQTW